MNDLLNFDNTKVDKKLVIYLFIFIVLSLFVNSLLFYVPFFLLCYKVGKILGHYILTKEIKKSNPTDLFIYAFGILSIGFYIFLMYKNTGLKLLLFSSISAWVSSLTYLIRLVHFSNETDSTKHKTEFNQ
jgi:hypothetical protein